MEVTIKTFLIVCPLVFLGGFVDAIGGGGGLISLPAYLLAGVPAHMAIATNKLSSAAGTTITTIRFIRAGLIRLALAIPTIIAALIGSFIGAKLSLVTDEAMLKYVLLPILAIAAFFVMNKKLFGRDYPELKADGSEKAGLKDLFKGIPLRVYVIATLSALIIGAYDGFYGPGTGTFVIIALNVFAHINIKQANAQAKAINLTTNLTSLAVFVLGGQVVWTLGLAAALFGILGNYIGSGLVLKNSDRITRPVIILVLLLLFIKIISGI